MLMKRTNIDTSDVQKKHGDLIGINKTVTEYAALLEQVSKDRAELLLEISQLQIQNAELSVSKEVYGPLEKEIKDLREEVAKLKGIGELAKRYKRELDDLNDEKEMLIEMHHDEVSGLKKEIGILRSQVTRMKNSRKNKSGGIDDCEEL